MLSQHHTTTLPRRTRSPLRMTHQKPTALFSKKASVLPLNLFSWSAASLATIAALSSYGTPAFGHCDGISYVEADRMSRYLIGIGPVGDHLVKDHVFNIKRDKDDFITGYKLHCQRHNTSPTEERNRAPVRTRQSFPSVTLDLINKNQISLDLDRYFTDPDGDELTYTAVDPYVVGKSVKLDVRGSTLYITALETTLFSRDSRTISVTARDPGGLSATRSFKYAITNEELTKARIETAKESTIGVAKVVATTFGPGKLIGGVGKLAGAGAKAIKAVKNGESVGSAIKSINDAKNTFKGSDDKPTNNDAGGKPRSNNNKGSKPRSNRNNDAGGKPTNNDAGNKPRSNRNDGGPYQMEITPEGGETEVVPLRREDVEITPNKSSSSINKTINNIAEALYLNHDLLQGGYISLDQAFSGQDFSVPFNLSQVFSQDQGSSPRFNALLSADIGFSRFSDSSDPGISIDGTTTNYGIGLTIAPNPEVPLITGLQFGYTRSNSDFEYTDTEGTYNLRMFSVSPFIAWDATDSLTVWSTIGYGRPNDEITIESVDGVEVDPAEDSTFTSSGDFFSFAGGANYRVWQSDLSALSIGLSGSTTSLLDNDSQQGSISAQFSHKFPFDAGQLQTSADLALILSDSGPSATELSGNLNWLPNQGRLSGSTNARVLLFGGDRSEWGIGGSVVLLPGERGEGLSLALRPSFGQTNTALSNLHLDPFSFSDPTELALSTAPLTARFNAELAYGFPSGNHALLTPYTKLSMGHYGATTSAGLRYQLDNSLDLDFSASHRQRSSGNNDNRFFLQLRSDL